MTPTVYYEFVESYGRAYEKKMADLIYELLAQAVKNTNININLSAKSTQPIANDPKEKESTESTENVENEPEKRGLVKADIVQLIDEMEMVSKSLKRINRSLVENEYTEAFFMIQNFDTILNWVKMVVHAV